MEFENRVCYVYEGRVLLVFFIIMKHHKASKCVSGSIKRPFEKVKGFKPDCSRPMKFVQLSPFTSI